MRERPSICYAAPGHSLLSTSGTTRNILSVAEALSRWADVTVAFRSVREPIQSDKFKVDVIEPQLQTGSEIRDDVAARGLNIFAHIGYLSKLVSFAKHSARSYDLVFEKGWRLSGFLSMSFGRYGVTGAVVANDGRYLHEARAQERQTA